MHFCAKFSLVQDASSQQKGGGAKRRSPPPAFLPLNLTLSQINAKIITIE